MQYVVWVLVEWMCFVHIHVQPHPVMWLAFVFCFFQRVTESVPWGLTLSYFCPVVVIQWSRALPGSYFCGRWNSCRLSLGKERLYFKFKVKVGAKWFLSSPTKEYNSALCFYKNLIELSRMWFFLVHYQFFGEQRTSSWFFKKSVSRNLTNLNW